MSGGIEPGFVRKCTPDSRRCSNAAISGVVECFKISKAAAKIGLASSCRHATALIPVFLTYRY